MNARRKGIRAENEAAALSSVFGIPCRRASRMYLPGFDAPDVIGLPGVHIEVKRREQLNMTAAMRQSKADAQAGEIAVVIHRPRRAAWLLTVALADAPALAMTLPPPPGIGSPSGESKNRFARGQLPARAPVYVNRVTT